MGPDTYKNPIEERAAPDQLVRDLDAAYAQFRVSLVRMLRAVGVEARSGSAIASRIGLNRQLAWQISTIVSEPTSAAGLNVLPGSKGLDIVVEACRKEIGDDPTVAEAHRALAALEEAVRTHAGDRASLSLIAAAWEPAGIESRTEGLRRDGYRAQCALLGVQAQTQIRGVIYAPARSGDPSRVSMATYQCFVDVTRFRRDHPVRLLYVEAPTHDDGGLAMPLDEMPSHMREKFELHQDFSSGSLADVETLVQGNRGWVMLRPGPIGRQATGTWVFTGSARYEHPRYTSPRDAYNQIGIISLVPTETLHVDCLMDRSLLEHMELYESVRVLCFDASTGLPMRPVSRRDPAYLFDVSTRSPLGPTEIECDASFTRLASVVDSAAKRIGSRLDNLVGVRFSSNCVMSPMDFVIERALPRPSQQGTK